MDLDVYNRSFEESFEAFEEEADQRLRYIRQQFAKEFVERLNNRHKEWEDTFRDILNRSQEEDEALKSLLSLNNNDNINCNNNNQHSIDANLAPGATNLTVDSKSNEGTFLNVTTESSIKENKEPQGSKLDLDAKQAIERESDKSQGDVGLNHPEKQGQKEDKELTDPCFSNLNSIKEFVRIQELLEEARKSFADLSSNPSCKAYKNDLNLFIRTQINSISNSDSQHLGNKTRQLTSLFSGQQVTFQDRFICASQHPQGQLFSMDLAAQTFVTVGTRLVNSVPAIAKSMATVINGIINSNLPIFKDLIIGHLQERCPYLVPIHPKLEQFAGQKDHVAKFKIACGYSYDPKSQALESDEKYLTRMRSMVLIYGSVLIQGHMHQAWTWLAAFLSTKPQPVISATVLQAFLQESSQKMSLTYGRQYNKVLVFIKDHYVKMIEDAMDKTTDRQSFIKLKNLLADDAKLLPAPSVGSIFGAIKFA